MRTIDDYLALVIREHADKPKFMAELRAVLEPIVAIQQFLAGVSSAFDLDSAVGVQLDVLGMFIGVSRSIGAPVTNNWFMLDIVGHGLDAGVWKSPYKTEYYTTVLDDVAFRRLLRTRIAANHWDGTIPGAQAIIDAYFTDPASVVFIEDGAITLVDNFFALDDATRGLDSAYPLRGPWFPEASDLHVVICFAKKIPSLPDIFLLYQGLLPIIGAGVRVDFRIASRDNAKLFALDISNDTFAGLDDGVWGADVDHIVTYGLS